MLNEEQLKKKCEELGLMAVAVDKIYQPVNGALNWDIETFLTLCKNANTAVVMYKYSYLDKHFLTIDDRTAERGCDGVEKKHLKAKYNTHIDIWNNTVLDNIDFSQPVELTIIASIDGVVISNYHTYSVQVQVGDVDVYLTKDISSPTIARSIMCRIIEHEIYK